MKFKEACKIRSQRSKGIKSLTLRIRRCSSLSMFILLLFCVLVVVVACSCWEVLIFHSETFSKN